MEALRDLLYLNWDFDKDKVRIKCLLSSNMEREDCTEASDATGVPSFDNLEALKLRIQENYEQQVLYYGSALDLVEKADKFTIYVGDDNLQRWFEDCATLQAGSVIEICGMSGTGKTQFAMQVSLFSILTPLEEDEGALMSTTDMQLGCRVLYICTAEGFPFKRFFELTRCLFPSLSEEELHAIGDCLLIHHIGSLDSQENFIEYQLPAFFSASNTDEKELPIRLLVLDSLACHVRSETHDGQQISMLNFAVAAKLKELALKYNLVILSVNQMTTCISDAIDQEEASSCFVPSLGRSWAYCLHSRFLFERSELQAHKRFISCVFSDCRQSFESTRIPFSLSASGISADVS